MNKTNPIKFDDNKPREKTEDEVRQEFLEAIWSRINYWKNSDTYEVDKYEGLAFSILSLLDGESCDLPGFIVAPLPSSEDKEYYIDNGENYYPENHNSNVKCDIAGGLHELFDKYKHNNL